MKLERLVFSAALLLISTAALAADPPAPSAAAAPKPPAAPVAAQAAAPASNAAPAAAAQASAPDAATLAKQAHALGYAQKSKSGKTYYCKAEASIGTRLESTKCFSEQEMTAVVLRSTQNQDSLAHMQRVELYEENKH